MTSGPLISSPANSEIPIPTIEYKVEMDIAYIYNKEDVVAGKIIKINPDETFDLTCLIPLPSREVKWDRRMEDFKIKQSTQLVSKEFLRSKPCNPATIFVKHDRALDRPIIGQGDGVKQTHVTEFIPQGTTRVPRFGSLHTSIIGKFFDPSLWYYQVRCWRAPIEVRKNQYMPEENRVFPNQKKGGVYTDFRKAFNKYFKEYHQNKGKWNRVDLIALSPEDIGREIDNKQSEIERLEQQLRMLRGE